ncbi:MAG: accessory Sec system glycosyltransferase GtfB [Ruminococcus flavefaciens]|nr:accessory Sec system glycosyltransferase GtfB [Ruminococcus flavefaciens]
MIFFCNKCTDNVKRLQETIRVIGLDGKIVVLENDGFVPKGTLSPHEYFIYRDVHDEMVEKELFFNFLEIPEYWKIVLINSTSGGIYDMDQKKASIYFAAPYEKRNVQRVEWHTENGWVYKIDYYNKYGLKYASEFRNLEGSVDSKVFYSDRNHEIIVEQPQNGIITLLEGGEVKTFFTSQEQFISYYMREAGLGDEYVLFVEKEEDFRLLDFKPDGENTWEYVLFSEQALLDKYISMGRKNGYRFCAIPDSYPANHARGGMLILTASDRIEGIEELIQALPEVVFYIAANTQVSDKINRLGEQDNVKIYPQISMHDLEQLWEQCDFYLDINYYREIYDAVNMAHWHNLLIMGFEDTVHHRELLAEELIFPQQDSKNMIIRIKELLGNSDSMKELLAIQQNRKSKVWRDILE